MAIQRVDIDELQERARAIEARHATRISSHFVDDTDERISTGWDEIDAILGGGLAAGLHEWFGVETCNREWNAPLCVFGHLAGQFVDQTASSPWITWIGQRCQPYPRILIRQTDRRLLEQSLVVTSQSAALRLWAIDLALRSPAIGCVIADISDFDRAATQRIQLLAKNQAKSVFATRSPRQMDRHSAAQTRWRIKTETAKEKKRWIVELLRCKGIRPTQDHHRWLLEWNRGKSAINLSSRLADLAGSPEAHKQTEKRATVRNQTA